MKQIIKLTESDLHKIIKESVNRILRVNESHGEPDPKVALIYDSVIEDYKAQEMAEEYGLSEGEAAAEWFKEVGGEMDIAEDEMPLHREYVMDIPELDAELYHDYGAEYYFLVKKGNGMANSFNESTIKEENGGGATSCANVMQTGSGKAPLGTNPEAGQYTVPFGPDKETSDRHKGFSVDGKAKWNKNAGNVQRKPIYKPKG